MARPFNSPDIFRAVAHPTRRRILDLLCVKPRWSSDIASQFKMSRTTIAEHLRALRSAGLIEEHDKGRKREYTLTPGRLQEVENWISRYRQLLHGASGR